LNRQDFTELLADVRRELFMPGGHFDALLNNIAGRRGTPANTSANGAPKPAEPSAEGPFICLTQNDLRQYAEIAAAIALTAADRYYARRTRMDFEIRTREEAHG
jgi:hypothetical protein